MTKHERLPFHDIANIFPLMHGAAFDALVADVERCGLREPIVKYKGAIVDGRNRYNACLKSNVDPCFVEWDEQGSLAAFVISANLHRRHLDESQRAMVAARIANIDGAGRPKEIASNEAISQTDAAEMVNVSRSAVQRAAIVIESCPAKVQDAVDAGEVSVSDAAFIADLPKREQAAALKAVESGDAKTLAATAKEAMLGRLDPAVKAAFDGGELTIAQVKKLSAMEKLDQLQELKKIREKAARKAAANAPSKQVVMGHKSNSGPKPSGNDTKSPAAELHKIIGKLSRGVDDHAKTLSWPARSVATIHEAINGVKQLILKAERGK